MPDREWCKPSPSTIYSNARIEQRTIHQFLTAAALQQTEQVKHFIEIEGVHPDATSSGKPTAICYAAMKRDPEMLGYLLAQGADANRRDALGMTPLHYAALGGCEVCVSALIQCDARLNVCNRCGETPLAIAERQSRDTPCRELLARYGASRIPGARELRRFH